MKKVFHFSAIALFTFSLLGGAFAGVGGSGGGPRAITDVHVEICDGQSTLLCDLVTYRVDSAGGPVDVSCLSSAGTSVACPNKPGAFPQWLRKLNEAYGYVP